jgi:hypothetical protein
MSTELHQRLAELADGAPHSGPGGPGGPGGAAELWTAGKRRQRRRTAAGAGAVVACLLVAMAAVGALRPAAPVLPAGDPGETGALPTQLHVPSRWTASNEDDPAGPFAVVSSASRGWSNHTALFGISALTGAYRFIGLPGLAEESLGSPYDIALSPDGRRIAYWFVRSDEENDGSGGAPPAGGVAVYDTATGQVTRHRMTSKHGLSPWSLHWVDAQRLYLQAGEIQGAPGSEEAGGSQATGPGWVWTLGPEGRFAMLAVPGIKEFPDVRGADGRGHLLIAAGRGDRHLLVDPDRPDAAREIKVHLDGVEATSSAHRVSSEGRVAVAASAAEGGDFLAVGAPDGTSRSWPAVRAWDVMGWADATHVIAGVSAGRADGGTAPATSFVKVQVDTGTTEPFIAMPADAHLNPPQFATSLLATAPVDRPAPATPANPALLPGGIVLALGAALLGGWLVRRRRARV